MSKKVKSSISMRTIDIIGVTVCILIGVFFGMLYYNKTSTKLEIYAGEVVTKDDLKAANGKNVTVHGYISPYSPDDGSYVYITAKPFDNNVNNGPYSTNGVHAFCSDDMMAVFTGIPVTVKGVLVYSNVVKQDEFDILYSWYLDNISISAYETQTLTPELYNYSTLASQGILDAYITSLYAAMFDIYSESYGYGIEDLEVYPTANLTMAANLCGLYDNDESKELLELINRTGVLLDTLNGIIESGNIETLKEYQTEGESITSDFSVWCEKFVLFEME